MQPGQQLIFRSFRLDPVNERLWRGTRAITLRPKTFAVLRYLLEHAGQLVTKEHLLDAVWPETSVSDMVPVVCVRELREALGDQADAPQFIQTVSRRGYRFIAPVVSGEDTGARRKRKRKRSKPAPSRQTSSLQPPVSNLVGREAELATLQRRLEKVIRGERQIVFVTGEPGIGKTTLLDAFLTRVTVQDETWIGHGLCIEHYGAGEAYLPVLDALGRMCRGSTGKTLIGLLEQYAPTWLVQMPALLSPAELDVLQRKIQGATRERMLREMAEVVEALSIEWPLVLVLEDLQWSDYSTLDLISFLARRRESARLLLIGSYRPMEIVGSDHPLQAIRQELQVHGQCAELPLGLLAETAVGEYLTTRFGGGAVHASPLRILTQLIYQRSDGNPLFMANMVEYLLAQGLLKQTNGQWELQDVVEGITLEVPGSLRQLIEKHIERLSPEEQRVLEAASVVGAAFSTAAVAAGLGEEVVQIEQLCAVLARREQFLRPCGMDEWPDGTVAGRYEFIHALYKEVLYQWLTAGQRLHLHRRIGERAEQAYGARVREIAAELAVHFEQGREYKKAVQYLQQAVEKAIQRRGYREAIDLLNKGFALLKTLPGTPERNQQELALQVTLGASLLVTKGYTAPEVERVYTRALELCQQVGETPWFFWVLVGLVNTHLMQGRPQAAHEIGEQLLALAQKEQNSALLVWAHGTLGIALTHLGERTLAQVHLEQGIALYDSLTQDPSIGVACCIYSASNLLVFGYVDQAMKRAGEALALAQKQSDPFSFVYASASAALFHHYRGEDGIAQKQAETAMKIATDHGFAHWEAIATVARGSALIGQGKVEEGIEQMHQSLTACQTTGAEMLQPWLLSLLVEGYSKARQIEEGLSVLDEALAVALRIGERIYEAELYRLKGALLLQSKVQGAKSKIDNPQSAIHNSQLEAEACFHQAIEIARQQNAKSLELRAVMSLSHLWQQQGKQNEARQILAEIYGWFTEGFDTVDLQEAKALLEELGS